MSTPIRPEDVPISVIEVFPDEVIDSINKVLLKHVYKDSDGYFRANILQDEFVAEILDAMNHRIHVTKILTSADVFKNRWLDFETLYSGFGWDVTYEKPGYNETGPRLFHFRERK